MKHTTYRPHEPQVSDDLQRTAWQDEDTPPTIAGQYECATGGGHIFVRIYTGVTWLSTVNGQPTTVKMPWRGVKPGSVDVSRYPAPKHPELLNSLEALEALAQKAA